MCGRQVWPETVVPHRFTAILTRLRMWSSDADRGSPGVTSAIWRARPSRASCIEFESRLKCSNAVPMRFSRSLTTVFCGFCRYNRIYVRTSAVLGKALKISQRFLHSQQPSVSRVYLHTGITALSFVDRDLVAEDTQSDEQYSLWLGLLYSIHVLAAQSEAI